MAGDLSRDWRVICEAILDVTDQVREHELEYGSRAHYSSLNALAVVWTWRFLALRWEAAQTLTVPVKDSFRKKCAETLAAHLDRWLICSQWAGRWAGASNTAVAGYAKALSGDAIGIDASTDPDAVHAVLAARFQRLTGDLEGDATACVTTLDAASRERVSLYRTLLWVWHRLEANRWGMSKIPLRYGKSKKTELDVDHTVAFALWDGLLDTGLPTDTSDREEAQGLVNQLGNCCLLEKSFNISKSDKTAKSFLEEIHEFKTNNLSLTDWCNAMAIPPVMLDPTGATADDIAKAIRERNTLIRTDMVDFVKGSKARLD